MSQVLSLKPSYYEALKRLTLELVGVNLGPDHTFLIETRLRSLARQEGYKDLLHMIEELFSQGQARLALQVVSALLERDTHFNPDPLGMARLENYILPNRVEANQGNPVRILSFGCSSGQEAYSIAIQTERVKQKYPGVRFDIVGIDYPSPALDRARKGYYTHFEVQRGLPVRDLIEFFDPVGEDWVVKPSLRERVTFKEHHLLSSLNNLGEFDIVVFRNGIPHYSSAAQIRVLRSLSATVKSSGFLLLGSQDRVPRIRYGFEPISGMPGVFQRQDSTDPNDEIEDNPVAKRIEAERLTMLETQLARHREQVR